jgi:hypothetical protein
MVESSREERGGGLVGVKFYPTNQLEVVAEML